MKTALKIIIIVTLVILQTLPVFILKPVGSKSMKNEFINLYYHPDEEKGAKEVFNLLVQKSDEIYQKMNFQKTEPIDVYIYKTQKQLALREAGFITLLFAPKWHIGDSHNGNIMMVSPYTPVKVHTHDSILTATLHELVHAINYRINKEISYFWDNSLATYLAGQVPKEIEYKHVDIPSIEDMQTKNGLKFGNMGGYAFSYKYIEFLDKNYGWDKVIAFAKGDGDYIEVFKKSEAEIYDQWCTYLKE